MLDGGLLTKEVRRGQNQLWVQAEHLLKINRLYTIENRLEK